MLSARFFSRRLFGSLALSTTLGFAAALSGTVPTVAQDTIKIGLIEAIRLQQQ